MPVISTIYREINDNFFFVCPPITLLYCWRGFPSTDRINAVLLKWHSVQNNLKLEWSKSLHHVPPYYIIAGPPSLDTNTPVTLGVTTSYNQPRPQNSLWSLVVFRRLLTIVQWSLEILGGLWVYLSSVVFYWLANAVQWFSIVGVRFWWSLAVGDHWLSVRRPVADQLLNAPSTTKLCFLLVIGRRSVGDQSATGWRPVKDHYQPSSDLLRLVATLVSLQYK